MIVDCPHPVTSLDGGGDCLLDRFLAMRATQLFKDSHVQSTKFALGGGYCPCLRRAR